MTLQPLDDDQHADESELSPFGNYWLGRAVPWMRLCSILFMTIGVLGCLYSIFMFKSGRLWPSHSERSFSQLIDDMTTLPSLRVAFTFATSLVAIILSMTFNANIAAIKKYLSGEDAINLDFSLRSLNISMIVILVFFSLNIAKALLPFYYFY